MRKPLSLLLSLILIFAALAMPAAAVELDYGALEAADIYPYGYREFHEGLMPVLVGDPESQQEWNYINENMQLVDLNRGRFNYVFDFYEGLAAVISDTGVGYIDTKGNLVIPCQYGEYTSMGEVWVGHFHDGKATVLKSTTIAQEFSYSGWPTYYPGTWEVGTIDKTGRLISSFKSVDMGDSIYEKGMYMLADHGMLTDEIDAVVETRYQSVAELTGAHIVDMDCDGYSLTVTNNTANRDSGTVGLVLSSEMVAVSFVDYELEPYESKTYSLGTVGVIGNPDPGFLLLNGWAGIFEAYVLHFKSDEDLSSFRSGIPQETDSAHYASLISQNKSQGATVVCYGSAGDQWLAKYGMTRLRQPYIYSDSNHSYCAK